MARTKYKSRPDGRRETTKSYDKFGPTEYTGKKHFYGKTDKEINDKIREFEESLMKLPAKEEILLKDLTDDWWELKQKQIAKNTVTSYQAKKNEIKEELGDIAVAELKSTDIFKWLSKVSARGLSSKGIIDRKSVLKNILDYAITQDIISLNPCRDVPRVDGKAKQKRHPASDKDIELLEKNKTASLMGRMFYFMEYTGCRIGEASVIQQKHIDRKNHKAVICQDIEFDGSTPHVKENPKTEAGIREIDLYDNVLEILPEYKDPETFIFFPEGLPRRKKWATMARDFRKETGITATAHQFRHTYAGIMHSAEIDVKDTQARMGHANISVTQDIYTEIERSHNEKARNKANKYIMETRLGKKSCNCPYCGGINTTDVNGNLFTFCPDCGKRLGTEESSKKSSKCKETA